VIDYDRKDVKDLFNAIFRNENIPISKSIVERTVRFEETGSAKNLPKTERPPLATNEEKALDVLQSFIENPQLLSVELLKNIK